MLLIYGLRKYNINCGKVKRQKLTSQQRLPRGTLRFGSLKFIYATSGKGRDVAEKNYCKVEVKKGGDIALK